MAMVRPMADLGLFLGEMAAWPASRGRVRQWLDDNDDFRRSLLALLTASGPLSSRDLPDTAAVPWASTGWTNDRNVTQMLEFMALSGQVAVAGRTGRQRLWDLASRCTGPTWPRSPSKRLAPSAASDCCGRWASPARRPSGRSACRRRSRARAACGASTRRPVPPASSVAPPCCHRSTASSTTASGRWSCSTSSTRSRCTSRPRSAAGATSHSRSSTTTGSSGRLT